MSKSKIVVSMDSHTQGIVDLKPYLAEEHHQAFDEGNLEAERTFKRGLEGAFFNKVDQAAASGDELGGLGGEAMDRWHTGDLDATFAEYLVPQPMAERLAAIDADGVAAEFITPFVGAYSVDNDPAVLHAITEAFDRWFADYISPAPHRFTGATAVNLRCGMDVVVDEVAHAYDHGLRAVTLPGKPRHASTDLPPFNARHYDPLWAALDERGMAAVWHVGLGREKPLLRWRGTEPGWEVIFDIDVSRGHLDVFPYIFGSALLERFPNMRAGFVESGATWVPPALAELDTTVRALPSESTTRYELLPSEVWQRQGFVATGLTPEEVEARHDIGIGNLMWGSDFPHVESSYPHSRAHLARILDDVPDDEADALVGGNAIRMMGFDVERLAQTPAAQPSAAAPVLPVA